MTLREIITEEKMKELMKKGLAKDLSRGLKKVKKKYMCLGDRCYIRRDCYYEMVEDIEIIQDYILVLSESYERRTKH